MERIEYTHVKALANIEDEWHLYCKKGTVYEILYDEGDGTVEIYCEPETDDDFGPILCLSISVGDPDFEFLIMEDDINED